jgi:hypothetical protein
MIFGETWAAGLKSIVNCQQLVHYYNQLPSRLRGQHAQQLLLGAYWKGLIQRSNFSGGKNRCPNKKEKKMLNKPASEFLKMTSGMTALITLKSYFYR